MFQRWENLLFMHWEMDPEIIQLTLPDGLQVDTFQDRAYLGIVPFFMKGIRPRFLPPVPGLSSFLELNLRTYVHDRHGRPGVWFYSLDANQWLAVKIARGVFSLPYFHARMSATLDARNGIEFRSRRPRSIDQVFHYKPEVPLGRAAPGSLEFFLTERYLLFSYNPRGKRLFMGQVHHEPYPLATARVSSYSKELFTLNGFEEPQREADHVIMADGVDVSVYGLSPVD